MLEFHELLVDHAAPENRFNYLEEKRQEEEEAWDEKDDFEVLHRICRLIVELVEVLVDHLAIVCRVDEPIDVVDDAIDRNHVKGNDLDEYAEQ